MLGEEHLDLILIDFPHGSGGNGDGVRMGVVALRGEGGERWVVGEGLGVDGGGAGRGGGAMGVGVGVG